LQRSVQIRATDSHTQITIWRPLSSFWHISRYNYSLPIFCRDVAGQHQQQGQQEAAATAATKQLAVAIHGELRNRGSALI
jgi:hypothetical protein